MAFGGIETHHGDSREVLKTLANDSIDSCVTDPPYALTSIVERFSKTAMGDDTTTSDRARRGADSYARFQRGFMVQERPARQPFARDVERFLSSGTRRT